MSELTKLLGNRILSEANDLKRTVSALAEEIDIDEDKLKQILKGECDLEESYSVIERMGKKYPIDVSDLYIEEDDCTNSVKIMRAEDSLKSSRTFLRKDKDGNKTPYYEYRDTAMSKHGPFKPEWIKELRVVDDNNPENPDVAYNNGHFLHQATFFFGEVNFYYEVGGKKYCEEMNTGDSNYITPFVPHSFASRNKDALGLIVAVTYGGKVRRALKELYLLRDRLEHLKFRLNDDGRSKVFVNKGLDYVIHKGISYNHTYAYNYGEDVEFEWVDKCAAHKEIIRNGDSVYIQPLIHHSFSGNNVFVCEVEGAVDIHVRKELSQFVDIERIVENKCWFD